MKQETIEEAAVNYIAAKSRAREHGLVYNAIKFGANWQAERMYSKEDMKLAFETGRNFQLTGEDNFNELIEQFKKKA